MVGSCPAIPMLPDPGSQDALKKQKNEKNKNEKHKNRDHRPQACPQNRKTEKLKIRQSAIQTPWPQASPKKQRNPAKQKISNPDTLA